MPSMTRNAIVVDLNRCIGCFGCEVACKQENDVPLGQYWSRVTPVGPLELIEGGQYAIAGAYALASVVLCVAGVLAGKMLTRALMPTA